MGKEISAIVIADSVSPHGDRITTLELTFPRFLLAELNTHRAFSRNSASSRARSVKKTIQEVRDDPFVPVHWPSEKVGMAGGAELTGLDRIGAERLWRTTAKAACDDAEALASDGLHKSLVNRLLEPFMWHTTVVTATDWGNFFAQRLALLEDGTPAAELHFLDLAQAMRRALGTSTLTQLDKEQWHLPYVTSTDHDAWASGTLGYGDLLKISVARCAGVSYLNQGADRPLERDLALYARLRAANPPHWSPFEHVARPASTEGHVNFGGDVRGRELEVTLEFERRYNLTGWASLRWFLENGAQLDEETR